MKIEMTVPAVERIPDVFLDAKACIRVLVRKGLRGRRTHAVQSALVRSNEVKNLSVIVQCTSVKESVCRRFLVCLIYHKHSVPQ
jgi:hypothetical protein